MTLQKHKTFNNNCICIILSLIGLGCVFMAAAVCFVFDFHEWNSNERKLPLVINTWAFTNATATGWDAVFCKNLSAIDAVELGCSMCEIEQCDFTVGFGGSPDEEGETTLDAFIMDGMTMNVGAVGALRRVKSAISVARHVLEHTGHSILVGELATKFAIQMGFKEESLTTNQSQNMLRKWVDNNCQPNYWTNVKPDPKLHCGPYRTLLSAMRAQGPQHQEGHDTISMITLDRMGQVAVGTSSNGANHKIPGRVGDAPLVGAGGYADGKIGAAACTGDGDVMMRFLPSFLAVEEMRKGASPSIAAATAISRIKEYYPSFFGAIITVNLRGEYAAACNGMSAFPFSVHSPDIPGGKVELAPCV